MKQNQGKKYRNDSKNPPPDHTNSKIWKEDAFAQFWKHEKPGRRSWKRRTNYSQNMEQSKHTTTSALQKYVLIQGAYTVLNSTIKSFLLENLQLIQKVKQNRLKKTLHLEFEASNKGNSKFHKKREDYWLDIRAVIANLCLCHLETTGPQLNRLHLLTTVTFPCPRSLFRNRLVSHHLVTGEQHPQVGNHALTKKQQETLCFRLQFRPRIQNWNTLVIFFFSHSGKGFNQQHNFVFSPFVLFQNRFLTGWKF